MSGLQRKNPGPSRRTLGGMEADERERRAIARALARGGARRVEPGVYPDTYRVLSGTREGRWFNVSVEGGTYRCDCEAGLGHAPCAHAAAVYVARLEAEGIKVTGPAGGPRPGTTESPTASSGPDLPPAPRRRPRKEVALL